MHVKMWNAPMVIVFVCLQILSSIKYYFWCHYSYHGKNTFELFFLSRKTKSYKFSKARQIYPFRSKTRQCESFCSHRAWKFIFVSRIVESGRDFFTFFKWTPQFKKQSFLTTRQFCLLIFKNGNYYYFTQCKIYFKKFMISLVKIGFTNQYFFIIQILISESRTLAAKWRSWNLLKTSEICLR